MIYKGFFILWRIYKYRARGGFYLEDIQVNLLELAKEFVQFADNLYNEKKIDLDMYIEITKIKKEFIHNS